MPWAAAAGALVGAVANKELNKGSSGGGGGGGGGPTYVPADLAGSDANFLYNKGRYEGNLNDQYAATSGANNQLLQGQLNNPYNQMQQGAALFAQNDYMHNAQQAEQASLTGWNNAGHQSEFAQNQQKEFSDNFANVKDATKTLYGMGTDSNAQYKGLMDYQQGQLSNIQQSQGNLYGAGNQVLQTSQDPQQALYNRTQQQLTDQTRASEYARGIQTTPYGAALENNANQNFNIDWQNQQLARQAQGLQAAQGAYGSAQGMGNSYTNSMSGLQSAKNDQYANLTGAAGQQFSNYMNAMNQSNAVNAQTLANTQQNAANIGNYAAGQVTQMGQAQNSAYQNIYNQQNMALQNYQSNNQGYLQGLNQLQSNDLGYMNNGQGAQNQAFQQNAYNTNQRQNAISSISGPLGNAVRDNWGSISNGVSNWANSGSNNGNDPDLMAWANSSGY